MYVWSLGFTEFATDYGSCRYWFHYTTNPLPVKETCLKVGVDKRVGVG